MQPPQSFFNDWQAAGVFRQYHPEQLYIYMDGAAELYLETGFNHLSVQSYRNSAGDELKLEIFRMKDDTAALAMLLWEAGPIEEAGLLETSYKSNPYQLVFNFSVYFVRIANFSGDSLLLVAMVELARIIIKKIGISPVLTLLNKLPRRGRLPFSERIFRGPIGWRRFLGRGFILPLTDENRYVVAAKYRHAQGGSYYHLIFFYPNQIFAQNAFKRMSVFCDSRLIKDKWVTLPQNSGGKIKAGLKRNRIYLTLYFNK